MKTLGYWLGALVMGLTMLAWAVALHLVADVAWVLEAVR